MTTITATREGATRHTVRDGKRVIGFLLNITKSSRIAIGWRFIANRKDIAARIPSPSPVFGTPEEALVDAKRRLGL